MTEGKQEQYFSLELVVKGRWQPRAVGEGLGLGRDVAQSLTGHQQPQHLLFLTSKGNRFVSD